MLYTDIEINVLLLNASIYRYTNPLVSIDVDIKS